MSDTRIHFRKGRHSLTHPEEQVWTGRGREGEKRLCTRAMSAEGRAGRRINDNLIRITTVWGIIVGMHFIKNPCTSSFTELIPRYLSIRLRIGGIGHRLLGERSLLYRSEGSRTKPHLHAEGLLLLHGATLGTAQGIWL